MLSRISFLLVITVLFIPSISFANMGIERGTEAGEIYIASPWYIEIDPYAEYHGIFYSTDNGETIALKSWSETTQPDTIDLASSYPISDATPGVLYCRPSSTVTLWISYNYGENWEFVEDPGLSGRYTAGCIPEEIYKYCTDFQGTFYRSIDFGNTFEVVNDSAKYIMEVGIQEGELYGIDGNYHGDSFIIHYSDDFGHSFPVEIEIDSTIAGDRVAGFYPRLSRGAASGEVYLTTWHVPCNYYIYRSTDYGQSFELQFQSEQIDIYYWVVYYTAGRAPGSFYVMMHMQDYWEVGTHLKIFYSDDYAQTFTEYYHYLDEDSVSVEMEDRPLIQVPAKEILLDNYPNPFNPQTTITYQLPVGVKGGVIHIFNIKGELIKVLNCLPERNYGSIIWNGTDDRNVPVPSGTYLYQLKVNNQNYKTQRMILLK